jgi:hypothetical protein
MTSRLPSQLEQRKQTLEHKDIISDTRHQTTLHPSWFLEDIPEQVVNRGVFSTDHVPRHSLWCLKLGGEKKKRKTKKSEAERQAQLGKDLYEHICIVIKNLRVWHILEEQGFNKSV